MGIGGVNANDLTSGFPIGLGGMAALGRGHTNGHRYAGGSRSASRYQWWGNACIEAFWGGSQGFHGHIAIHGMVAIAVLD